MVFKINVSHKGKTFKVETENESLVGYSINDKVDGKEISDKLEGYQLLVTGTSDRAGFMGSPNIDGPNLHKVLLGYGRGMRKKPKGETKINRKPKGLRLRKTVRGKEISLETVQINIKVLKEGKKKFDSLFEVPGEKAKEDAPKDKSQDASSDAKKE
ncbi:30S ribosomal protein S6e [archaeon]|nr:30S ribosomal protein S6e [archaeon]